MSPVLKALIFDFDGLILDTETPEYETWRQVYARHGQELPLSEWVQCVGTQEHGYDPFARLVQRTGQPLDREALQVERRAIFGHLLADAQLMPGVRDLMEAARADGVKLAVASSSRLDWVGGHLDRFGLRPWMESIKTSDDVLLTKPDPALYQLSLAALQVEAAEAVVFEDSLNGVLAARAAGIFAVAVPNPVTRILNFDVANRRINSLADLTLPMIREFLVF